MSDGPVSNAMKHLRRAVLLPDGAGLTDGELLEAFVAQRDGACFEALVRRHGPMVLGVCRRVLRNPHDAEDAFQATFLVLVRKADSVVPREMVGNWLYGVAYRTAREAKRAAARRRARERQVNDMTHHPGESEEGCRELLPRLDQELNRLPDKYRMPVVLCDLEGRTRQEAARQLGLPVGTVSGRLTTARRLLAKRLSRHGLTLSAGALAALSQGAAVAAVPPSLVASTVQAAGLVAAGQAIAANVVSAQVMALTDGVVKILSAVPLKTVSVLLLAGAVLGGAVFIQHRLGDGERHAEAGPKVEVSPPLTVAVEKSDREKLQGTWVAVSSERGGVKDIDPYIGENQLVFDGDQLMHRTMKGQWEGPFRLSPASQPKEMDADFGTKGSMRAIYELEGNRLKLCYAKGAERPTDFGAAESQLLTFLYVYEKRP